jgi:hypothetical protein
MTAQRQENKDRSLKIARLAMIAAVAVASAGSVVHGWAAVTERVVVNRHSGLAIDGMDPVAYFTDADAIAGDPEIEASDQGVIWRFRNARNRAIFIAEPEIYGPRFGGYDPTDVARGKAVAGRAQIWLVYGGRLFLFSRAESRDAFAAAPEQFTARADARWPVLMDKLSGY